MLSISKTEAATRLKTIDKEHREFFKEVYLRQKISPYEFDLFINMDHIPSGPQVARIIASAFEQKFQRKLKTR
jgi:hypothetical protein